MNFKKKEPLKTNGASSKLGFTVLLDPMLHDQINGENTMHIYLIVNIIFQLDLTLKAQNTLTLSQTTFTMDGRFTSMRPMSFPRWQGKGLL